MNHIRQTVALAGIALLLGACAPRYHYVPNNMVIPAFKKQHDAVLSGGKSVMGGWEFQAGYSPLKHLLLQYQYAHLPASPHARAVNDWERNQSWEAGLGGYQYAAPWTFSLCGGVGGGFSENRFVYPGIIPFRSRLDFRQWFVQPGLMLHGRSIRFGVAMRSIWLHFDKGYIDVPNFDSVELQAIRKIEQENPFRFTEFGFTLGYSLRPFTLSYNAISTFGDPQRFRELMLANSNHSLVLTLNVQELWPGKKRKEN